MLAKKKKIEAMWFFIIGSMAYCLFAGVFFFWDGRFAHNDLPFLYPVELLPLIPLVLVSLFVLYRN